MYECGWVEWYGRKPRDGIVGAIYVYIYIFIDFDIDVDVDPAGIDKQFGPACAP